jgi:hypothetical protein
VELIGESGEGDGAKGREAMCRWLGLDAALVAVPPREVILEEHFLPIDHVPGIEMVAAEIERELTLRSMLEAPGYDGHTLVEALKLGGAARDEVLATIDDSEWRLARGRRGRASHAAPRRHQAPPGNPLTAAGHAVPPPAAASCYTFASYFCVDPASTGSVTPVMYRASSDARNSTALETSRGSTHGIGSALSAPMASAYCSAVGFSTPGRNTRMVGSFCTIGVLTPVGCTELTRMECGASSSASVRMSPTTPCLAAT